MTSKDETHVESLAELLDSFVICRTVGHSWDDNPHAEINSMWSWVMALRCTRCTCERFDALNNLGEVVSRSYRYPDGYRITANRQGERTTRVGLRTELMRRRILARRIERATVRKGKKIARGA